MIIGGGAAGFFTALQEKKTFPYKSVLIVEKTARPLAKVRVSGGGRCNVTHAEFDPKELIKNYPRGGRELLGPFFRFQPRDTFSWFEEQNIPLKIEPDGRVFPKSNSSETIIECFLSLAKKRGVEIALKMEIESLKKRGPSF